MKHGIRPSRRSYASFKKLNNRIAFPYLPYLISSHMYNRQSLQSGRISILVYDSGRGYSVTPASGKTDQAIERCSKELDLALE